MNKFIIPIHSIVDVITNSSTELFIIDKEKGLEFVKEIVNEGLKQFPAEDYHKPSVYLENPEYYGNGFCESEESAIEFLKLRGFKIEAPENPQEPEAIIISWERGYMDNRFIKFIEDTFQTELIDH